MKRSRLERLGEQLAAAPQAVRERMLADADALKPGAAAVVGRFFTVLAERGEPHSAPSRASFDRAARSEPTLHTLLVALERYAPEVNLAAGRESRRDWYRRRGWTGSPPPSPLSRGARDEDGWPGPWRTLLPGFEAARPRLSNQSAQRYLASIARCARAVRDEGLDPRIDRWLGARLLAHFEAQGLAYRTAANYLVGLEALARYGGADETAIRGLADVVAEAKRRGDREGRAKDTRLHALHERGGYAVLVETAARLRHEALGLPAWSAAAERKLQGAAILALVVNAPARSGDLARWRLGEHLTREPFGVWRLAWRQGKTRTEQELGTLWPEVEDMLDHLLCRGRARRFAHHLYGALHGRNWLTHREEAPSPRWASALVKDAVGVPLHDVRTLAADYLRRHAPEDGAHVASTLLGHRDATSIAAYRALADGTAAARDWQAMRQGLTASHGLRARADRGGNTPFRTKQKKSEEY